MPFLTECPDVTIENGGCSFLTKDDFVYEGKKDRFLVEKEFRTDFATIPALVSWLIPKLGLYTLAAILHDWFCEALKATFRKARSAGVRRRDMDAHMRDHLGFTARDADAIFRRVMREQGVDLITRWLVWTGVRWGALFSPYRRAGWLRTFLPVLGISILVLPIALPATLFALGGRVIVRAVSWLVRLFGGRK